MRAGVTRREHGRHVVFANKPSMSHHHPHFDGFAVTSASGDDTKRCCDQKPAPELSATTSTHHAIVSSAKFAHDKRNLS